MKTRTKFIILVAFVAAAVVSVKVFGLGEYLDQERLRAWIDSYGVWGPLVYMLLYSIAPSLMLPGLPITVIGGVLFGPIWGTVYVMIGATVGAGLAFLLARKLGREWVASVIKGGRLEELDKKVEEQGWKIVAFTRLIPLFPFNFLNYAFGLTRIKFTHYIIATFIFIFPGAVAFVVFSSSILGLFHGRISKEFAIGAALVIIVSLIPVLYKRFKGRGA
jgi:uncharacterized membrane protein YdjX (TVP38/TMEM64 family)